MGTLDFLQSATDTADLATYTFASQNFGAAASDRYIIVTIMARKSGASTTITGVTIGGVTATEVVQRTNNVTNSDIAGIFIAAVPTGTSGDVVVTLGATMVRCAIGLYATTGLSSATPYDSDSSVASPPSVSLDVPVNGFIIGAGLTAASTTATLTGITEDYDSTLETFVTFAGGHDEVPAGEAGRTTTISFGSNTEPAGVFASWKFANEPIGQSFGNLAPMIAVGGGMSKNERAT